MAKPKVKKMTAEQKRKARNEYSRKWKAAHAEAVKRWNKAWLKRNHKTNGKKASKKRVARKPKPAAVPAEQQAA